MDPNVDKLAIIADMYGALSKGEIVLELDESGNTIREIEGIVNLDINGNYKVKPAVPTLWVAIDNTDDSMKVFKTLGKAKAYIDNPDHNARLAKFMEAA